MRSIVRSGLSILGFFVIWELVARLGLVPSDYFPSPLVVVQTLWSEIQRGEILRAGGTTFVRALAGATAASLLGIGVAMLSARYSIVRRAFGPIAEFLRPLPPAAIVPLAIFFLGLGWKLYSFILVFACFWPVYLNASQALAGTPRVQIETARTFGYSDWAILARVRLPAALPTIFIGVRLAASVGLIAATAAEMIAGRDGLGFYLMDAGLTLRVAETFAGLVVAMIAGLLINGLAVLLRSIFAGWQIRMARMVEGA